MKAHQTIVNPTRPGALRPVEFITDRAKRYRAVAAITQKEKRCIYCGTKPARPMVDHIDGRESNGNPENLAWACRSCNTTKGAHYARQGAGQRPASTTRASQAKASAVWRSSSRQSRQ